MDTQTTKQPLALDVSSYKVKEATKETLLKTFQPFVEQAEEWMEKAQAIKVTDESQTSLMQEAGTARKAIKKIRVDIEHTRKDLKEDSKNFGQAVDGVARFLREKLEPIEKVLETQEKFIEIKRAEEKEALKQFRRSMLESYVEDVTLYRVEEMSEEEFEAFLNGQIKSHEDKIKREEEERLESLRRAEEEKKRIAAIEAENKRLAAEQKKKDDENRRLQEELRKKTEEAKTLANSEPISTKQEELSKNTSESLSDKQKLLNLSNTIASTPFPEVESKEAQEILNKTSGLLKKVDIFIRENAEKIG